MGNTCTPVADPCQCMAKPLQYCKVISLQLKKKKKRKQPAKSQGMQRIPDNEKSDMLNMDSYWENKAERKRGENLSPHARSLCSFSSDPHTPICILPSTL